MTENRWVSLSHNEGYTVDLLQVQHEGKTRTVAIDNFSVAPFSVHDYDCKQRTFDEDWENVYSEVVVRFDSYDKGMDWIKQNLPNEFDEIMTVLSTLIDDEYVTTIINGN